MKPVYAPANAAEAHMLAHMLEQNGIAAHIHGEALQGAVGELPAGSLLQLLVADEDFERARALIAAWERTNVPSPDGTTETPRPPIWLPLIVFVIGVGAGWALKAVGEQNAIAITSSEVRYDQNADGVDDLIYHYRLGASEAFKATADVNFDGTMDSTDFFDASGIITRREADENVDGHVESITIYTEGLPTRTDIDRNRNGVSDVHVYYRNGVVSREEVADNRTGRIARVNYYENFLLARSETDLDGDGFLETVRTYDERGEITATETRPRG